MEKIYPRLLVARQDEGTLERWRVFKIVSATALELPVRTCRSMAEAHDFAERILQVSGVYDASNKRVRSLAPQH